LFLLILCQSLAHVVAEAGKTTLARSMERGWLASLWQAWVGGSNTMEKSSDVARTRGVAVRRLSIPGQLFSRAEFSLWDYAGQEEASKLWLV
jgi:GTPase SAR1 family protein